MLLLQHYYFHIFPIVFHLILCMTPILVCLIVSLFVFLFFLHFCHFSTLRKRIGKRVEKVRMCVSSMCLCFWESVGQRPKTISIKTKTSCQCHSAEKSSQNQSVSERDVIERMTKHAWLQVCMCVSVWRAGMCECIQCCGKVSVYEGL